MEEGIFISYRRRGGSTFASLLYSELCKHFDTENVFKDVNSLKPGSNFKNEIDAALEKSSIFLPLIDENWVNQKDESGNNRILSTNDYVYYEIKTAIERNLEIIPVLFENAVMPKENELPETIHDLCMKQAFFIQPESLLEDISTLIKHIRSKRKFLFEQGTLTGQMERIIKDPVNTFKTNWGKTFDSYKKDFTYLKSILKKKKD